MKGFGRLVWRAFSQQTRSFESPLNNKNKNPHFFISLRGFIQASSSSSSHLDHQLRHSRFASLKSSPVSPLPFRKWGLLGGQRRGMFIQTQSTPNPSSLMFYPGKPIMEVGSADFPNVRSAMSSPLAKALYGIDGQKRGLKTLCRFKGKSAGRNSSGRITIFHRGGGAKRLQRSIDLKRSTSSMGIVERIEYDPNRSSRIALVRWTEGVHLPRQRSNTVEEFAPPHKIFDPNTTTVRGLFSFSSLPGIFQVDQSKKTSAREVFISAFSSPKAKGDTTPLSFPRVAVAGANPAFLAPRMTEKLKGEDSSPCEVQKWRPSNSILWAHRIKRKAALSWQSSRQQKSLGLAAKTAAAKHTATH